MKLIFIHGKQSRALSLHLGNASRVLLGAGLLFVPLLLGAGGFGLARIIAPDEVSTEISLWRAQLEAQGQELAKVRDESNRRVDGLSVRLAELQARLMRLDALGERVAEIAKLDQGEFDFTQRPAVGGAAEDYDSGDTYVIPEIEQMINQLEQQLQQRERQLGLLENQLVDIKFSDAVNLNGWPIEKGWLSSHYGRRNDPFSGKLTFHNGIDFASTAGAPVLAIASGVVTAVENKSGYGLTVEVNHGSGYVTRYAHTEESLVVVGDLVKKGQAIATIGNSGRSTGPHLHIEVFKHGRVVDPASYIRRNRRP